MIRKSFSTRLTWFISALLLLTIVTIIVKEFVIDNNSIYVGKPVESIAFNPDGKEIATISSNGPQIWSSTDHSLLKSLGDQWGAPIVAWSPDGQLLATQGPAFTRYRWRTRAQRVAVSRMLEQDAQRRTVACGHAASPEARRQHGGSSTPPQSADATSVFSASRYTASAEGRSSACPARSYPQSQLARHTAS